MLGFGGGLVDAEQGLHSQAFALGGQLLHGSCRQFRAVHAALHERDKARLSGGRLTEQVVDGGGCVIVQVVRKVKGIFLKTFAGNEGMGIQADTALLVDAGYAQAQPLIQNDA